MKKAITTLALGLSVAALAAGGIAYAEAQAARPEIDADGDGVFTRAEVQKGAEAMFAALDANHDGKLDMADRQAHRATMRGRMFDRIDSDHDGRITRDEFLADRDSDGPDGDGADGPDGKPGPHGPGMGGPGMDRPRMDGPHAMHGGHGGMAMMLARMADADGNGAVSQAEFAAAAMKHFDMADANRDGKVTAEERKAMHARMMADHKRDGHKRDGHGQDGHGHGDHE